MDIADVQRFRVGAFLDRVVRQLRPDSMDPPQIGTSKFDASVDLSVQQVGDVIDPGRWLPSRTMELGQAPKSSSLETLGRRSRSVDLLLFLDDMRLLQLGSASGYYPEDCVDEVLDDLRQRWPALQPVTSLAEDVSHYWERPLPADHWGPNLDPSADIVRFEAEWRDVDSPSFRACVDLLLFATEDEWTRQSQHLAELAARIFENPALSLTPDEIERLSWGLAGADALSIPPVDGQDFAFDIGWSTTRHSVQERSGNRFEQLAQIRESIARVAVDLTVDENAGASRRLSRSIQFLTLRSRT